AWVRGGGRGAGGGGVGGLPAPPPGWGGPRLLRDAESGRLPAGCTSAVLLDRGSAARVTRIAFRRP
ncbi:ATP-binding protein, partial [Streptomyces sp. NPDC059456]